MERKKIDKNKLLTYSVVIFLILIFVVGIIWGLNQVLSMEGAFPPEEVKQIAEVKTKAEALNFADKYLNDVLNTKPLSEGNASFSVDSDSITTNGSEQLNAAIGYIQKSFANSVKSNIQPVNTTYGEDMTGKLRVPQITADDIQSFEFTYTYATCKTCGEKYTEGGLLNCTKCNSVFPDYLRVNDDYTLVLHIKQTDSLIKNNFYPRSEAEKAEMLNGLESVLNVNSVNTDYNDLIITFSVDRVNDRLKSFSYDKKMTAAINGDFLNGYAPLGNVDIGFNYDEQLKYSFTWAGISLNEHNISVEPKSTDNLLATLSCDDPLKYDAVWSSSDESIITVDSEGYFKAGKKTGTAVISASFDFNGVTYTDLCEVSVKISVESISVSKRKVTLNTGDSFLLSVKTNPAKATIKTVKWYSDDDSVATVDKDGNISAVKSGTVTVYALSDDGYYKSTCEVTVK